MALFSAIRDYHRRLSLHRKVFFSSLTLLFLILVVNSIAYWRIFIPMFVDQMKTYSLRVAYYLATRCRPLILSGDLEELHRVIVLREAIEYEIAYIFVTDETNRMLAYTFPEHVPPEIDSVRLPGPEEERIRLIRVGQSWIYDTAVLVKEGTRLIGVIHVGMRKTPLDRMIREMGVVLVLLMVVTVGLAVFLSQLAATYITTPLKRLTTAMKQLARGLDQPLPSIFRSQRCWEVKDCARTECAAYGNTLEPCWTMVARTHSGQQSDSEPLIRGVCKVCRVYREAQGDEIAQLAHAFGEIIWSMRAKAEELASSEKKRRLLFDYDPNGVFLVERSMERILEANQTAMRMLGCQGGELLERDFLALLEEEDAQLLRSRASGCPAGQAFDIPKLRVRTCAQEQLLVNLHARVVELPDATGPCLLVRMVDVTKRLQEESLLIQASKMATLGEMATGVAHELNQPLNVIKVGADFFHKMANRKESIQPDKLLTIAKNMSEQVDRASRIIDHLREFGRKSEFQLYPTDLNQAIRGAFTLLGQQLALREISVELNLQPDLPRILGDKNRLEQIFLNLITNARDAMTSNAPNSPRRLTVASFAVKDRVVVEVSDTGVGIPQAVLGRIFEPFFTTKPPGEGTGLGLSITYNLVKDFKGSIEVQSTVGVGTTFLLSFPAYREAEHATQEASTDR
jgi:two-component system NtrC family sensor kinase